MNFIWLKSCSEDGPDVTQGLQRVIALDSWEDPVAFAAQRRCAAIIVEVKNPEDVCRALRLAGESPGAYPIWIYQPSATAESAMDFMKAGASQVATTAEEIGRAMNSARKVFAGDGGSQKQEGRYPPPQIGEGTFNRGGEDALAIARTVGASCACPGNRDVWDGGHICQRESTSVQLLGHLGVTHTGCQGHGSGNRIDGERLRKLVQKHQLVGGINDPAERMATSEGAYSMAVTNDESKGVYRFRLMKACCTEGNVSRPVCTRRKSAHYRWSTHLAGCIVCVSEDMRAFEQWRVSTTLGRLLVVLTTEVEKCASRRTCLSGLSRSEGPTLAQRSCRTNWPWRCERSGSAPSD